MNESKQKNKLSNNHWANKRTKVPIIVIKIKYSICRFKPPENMQLNIFV